MGELNRYIEHTLLKPDTRKAAINKLCDEALQYQFRGVCVPPVFVADAHAKLEETDVKVVTVIGFPLGYTYTGVKVQEAKQAIEEGADELDMVMNLAWFNNGDYNRVLNEIDDITTIAHLHNKQLKVIIESGMLSDEQIVKACELCVKANADIVKTSTGFAEHGASVEQVELMRKVLPKKTGIKASGGIKDKLFAQALIAAGATRIGTSSGVKIVTE